MSREGSLVKNTLVLSIGTVFPKLASFVVLPILTGCLTKSEYGTYDLITVLCSLFLPAVTLQIQTAAFRFLIEKKDDSVSKKKIISNILLFLVPVSLVALIILVLLLYEYSFATRSLICMYFFFDLFFGVCGQIARGLQNNKVYAEASIVSSLSNLVFVVVFVYMLRWGLNGTLICMCVSMLTPTVVMIIQLRMWQYIDVRLFDKKVLKELLNYSWPMVPNSMSMWVMNASDRLVISAFLGIEANAIYAVAKKIPNIVTIAQSTFTMAWQESASLASEDKDSEEYYSKMYDTVFSMMAGIMAFITACMPLLFKILIRGDYDEAYYQMPILIMGMFFFSIASYLGGVYVAKKETKSVGFTTLIAATINLVTNLMMVKFIGVYAASISTLLSYIFLAFYRMYNIQKFTKIRYKMSKIIAVIAVLIAISACSCIRNIYMYAFEFAFAVIVMILLNKSIIEAMWKVMISKLRKKIS